MSSAETIEPRALRKANDAHSPGRVQEPTFLFDEFWREGEVALLFGPHGVGKSFLAIEIAESLARGRRIEGLQMSETRRNVLYVDLVLSDSQFSFRYSCEGRAGRRKYKFASNFYRDYPEEGEDLIEWLRVVVERDKINVVVIDDLSMVSRTDDGTQQTLELIRELRRMTRRLGISALVLADTHPYIHNREMGERDLRRRRVLCAHADSVFAMSIDGGCRHLAQTRSQSDSIVWTQKSPAHFSLASREDGFVGVDYLVPQITEQERDMICKIKSMRDLPDHPVSYRVISTRLGISKSTAARLYARWHPTLERKAEPGIEPSGSTSSDHEVPRGAETAPAVQNPQPSVDDEPDDDDRNRYGFDPDADLSTPADEQPMSETVPYGPEPKPEPDSSSVPSAAGIQSQSILDLERGQDHNGNLIFIESRREHDQKPLVWYQYNPKSKTYTRWERTVFTTRGKNVGRSHYLERPVPSGMGAVRGP